LYGVQFATFTGKHTTAKGVNMPQIASKLMQALRTLALRYPEAEEGVACKGTALESVTVAARKKAFLFLRATEIRLKLGESLAEATKLAAKERERCKAGAGGWVVVTVKDGQSPPPGVLERWIDESYRLLAPKQLVAMLPERGLPFGSAARSTKKKVRKKKTPSARP